jgi:hypothetical protein
MVPGYRLERRTSTFTLDPTSEVHNHLGEHDAHWSLAEYAREAQAIQLDLIIVDRPHAFAPHRMLRSLVALYAVPVDHRSSFRSS